MDYIEKHKATIITVLITGTLIFAMFSFGLTQKAQMVSETFYELQPEKTPEEKLLEQLSLNENIGQSTNKAFNETDEFKEIMKNFKSLDRNDFDKNAKKTEAENLQSPEEETQETQTTQTAEIKQELAINDNERSSFSKINEIIAKRSEKKRQSLASNGNDANDNTALNDYRNRNSSVSYSLKERKDIHLPPPVYLCEDSGKIVINITVASSGAVTTVAYNQAASTSTNQCLIDSALEYAKEARFDVSSTPSQIGTITYIFVGKRR